jgi:EAL domain-containing protein (putative c-di-GMP-specific phosphodiesterase class I)
MDSFGTGLASLSQPVNFPFDKINIDQSLLAATENDASTFLQ